MAFPGLYSCIFIAIPIYKAMTVFRVCNSVQYSETLNVYAKATHKKTFHNTTHITLINQRIRLQSANFPGFGVFNLFQNNKKTNVDI